MLVNLFGLNKENQLRNSLFMLSQKEIKRLYRHKRIRKKVRGIKDRPRLCARRSLKNLYVQIVDDQRGHTLVSLSTLNSEIRAKIRNGGNISAAMILGETIAALAQDKGIKIVCFDRGGYFYHGRIKAFAEAARKGGLEF